VPTKKNITILMRIFFLLLLPKKKKNGTTTPPPPARTTTFFPPGIASYSSVTSPLPAANEKEMNQSSSSTVLLSPRFTTGGVHQPEVNYISF